MAKHLACGRVRVKNPAPGVWTAGGAKLPLRYVEALEQNQQIASCCRHPENHEIEAWYSSDEDRDKGIPDIYVNFCTCGRKHVRFCVGGTPHHPNGEIAWDLLAKIGREPDNRPKWETR